MKTIIAFIFILAIPLLLVTVLLFIIVSLLPQRIFRINPSKGENLYPYLTSWETK